MKEIIKKYYNRQALSVSEVNSFIDEYCRLFGKTPKAEEIKMIFELIQVGIFNLEYAIETAVKKLELPLRKLYDANGNLIKIYLDF